MEKFELVALANNVMSLRSLTNNETFHPGIGPLEEARILHVEQQRLVDRAQATENFTLWDVGLGAAANALAAIRSLRANMAHGPSPHRINIHSFDRSTLGLEFALQNASALGYIKGFEKEIRTLLDTGSVKIGDNLKWNFHLGDFCHQLNQLSWPAPDAIFYDPYSVKSNAEMWSLAHFTNLYNQLDPHRPVLMTNYSSATFVRVTLLLAGFKVGYGCAIDQKLHTTMASSHLELLQRPLDREWLYKRVRVSHSAAALREIPYKIAPILEEDFEGLCRLPQFAR